LPFYLSAFKHEILIIKTLKMEKFFKNPLYMGIATVSILVLVVLWIYDDKKNASKDFYGLLKPSTPTV